MHYFLFHKLSFKDLADVENRIDSCRNFKEEKNIAFILFLLRNESKIIAHINPWPLTAIDN